MDAWEGRDKVIQAPAKPFHIRRAIAGQSDVDFIVKSFDSALIFLSRIGSGAQWGKIPFSQRPAFVQSMSKAVELSSGSKENNADGYSVLVADRIVKTDESRLIMCGAAVLNCKLPLYIDVQIQQVKHLVSTSSFIYLHHLISNRQAGSLSRGVGDALLTHIKKQALLQGIDTLFVDCWSGNNGALVHYYEN